MSFVYVRTVRAHSHTYSSEREDLKTSPKTMQNKKGNNASDKNMAVTLHTTRNKTRAQMTCFNKNKRERTRIRYIYIYSLFFWFHPFCARAISLSRYDMQFAVLLDIVITQQADTFGHFACKYKGVPLKYIWNFSCDHRF